MLQEKRSLDFRPRLGRRSNEDNNEQPKPYDVLFTPRMGKRSDIFTNYTPRLGRSINSGDSNIWILFFTCEIDNLTVSFSFRNNVSEEAIQQGNTARVIWKLYYLDMKWGYKILFKFNLNAQLLYTYYYFDGL